jgi:UMF1 family MFS transporter
MPGQVVAALVLVVIANIAYELGTVFYNAFLPDLAPPGRIGTVSGLAWGLGYIGGLLALAFALLTLVQPEVPWFGFSTEGGENIRATNLVVAAWFLVFSVPLLLWVPEDRSRASVSGRVIVEAFAQLKHTFVEIRKYRHTVRFLLARLLYNDGLVTVFAFGGIYAAGTFGFAFEEVLLFGIIINVGAGLGAAAMGLLDDRIGGKRTIMISLVGLIAASLLAILATSALWFWVAGILLGLFVGPNQAASRSLMGRFVPHELENEFFGFFAFSGKLTAFIGPFLLGVLTGVFDSQRVGISIVVVLFALGLVLLWPLDEQAGSRARTTGLQGADRSDAATRVAATGVCGPRAQSLFLQHREVLWPSSLRPGRIAFRHPTHLRSSHRTACARHRSCWSCSPPVGRQRNRRIRT